MTNAHHDDSLRHPSEGEHSKRIDEHYFIQLDARIVEHIDLLGVEYYFDEDGQRDDMKVVAAGELLKEQILLSSPTQRMAYDVDDKLRGEVDHVVEGILYMRSVEQQQLFETLRKTIAGLDKTVISDPHFSTARITECKMQIMAYAQVVFGDSVKGNWLELYNQLIPGMTVDTESVDYALYVFAEEEKEAERAEIIKKQQILQSTFRELLSEACSDDTPTDKISMLGFHLAKVVIGSTSDADCEAGIKLLCAEFGLDNAAVPRIIDTATLYRLDK